MTSQNPYPVIAQPPIVHRKRSNALWLLAIAPFMVLVLALAVLLMPVPYVIISPGPAPDALGTTLGGEKIISVTGVPTYPTTGSLRYTSVRLHGGPDNRPVLLVYLVARISDKKEVIPEKQVFPQGVTRNDVREEGRTAMENSQALAERQAALLAGMKVTNFLQVHEVEKGSPATGILQEGDQIVSIAGTPMKSLDDIPLVMAERHEGEKLSVTYKRGSTKKTASITLAKIDGKARLGILLSQQVRVPFKVQVNVGDIGGPSAGLMLTLAIYDVITPGPLTKGKNIAGTGEIRFDGSVGPIGGIREKLHGAKRQDAEYFLVPAENCAETIGHVPDNMRTVRVSNATEALQAVKNIADGKINSLPKCS